MAKKEYKQLTCRDARADCDFLVRAETEEEVLKVAADHACRIHGKCDIPPDKIRPLIKNVAV